MIRSIKMPDDLPTLYCEDVTKPKKHEIVGALGVPYLITAMSGGWSIWVLGVWNDMERRKKEGCICELLGGGYGYFADVDGVSRYQDGTDRSLAAAVSFLARHLSVPPDSILHFCKKNGRP